MNRLFQIVFFLLISPLTFAHDPGGNYLFIENKGQWPEDILFRSEVPSGYLFIKKTGLEYFFYDSKAIFDLHAAPKITENAKKEGYKIKTSQVKMEFLNSLPTPEIVANKATDHQYNFFLGNDSSKWTENVQAYSEIWLKEIYSGIDFRIYNFSGSLKYEYILHAGANPDLIKLAYYGQDDISVNENGLKIKTEVNVFNEFTPFTYQQNNKAKKAINSRFKINEHVVSFDIGDFDKQKELIIDPELVFSTYSGSFSDNWSHTATFDSKGNLYAGGTVFGPVFPATLGSVQTTEGNGPNATAFYTTDVVIMKYSSDGSKLLYATFLGGLDSEVPHSMVCNSKDELVVFGTTSSVNFPVSSNAFDQTFNGGKRTVGDPITSGIAFLNGSDIFVSVLSENGDKLKGSTFMGGSANDGIHDYRAFFIQNYGDEFRGEVNVDKQDNIYVASISQSENFPLINSDHKLSSSYDAVAFRLNSDLSVLQWSSFIGGSQYDGAYAIRIAENNDVYILGNTLSDGLSKGSNPLYSKRQGEADAFIALFQNDKLETLTYLGTSSEDLGSLMDIAPDGNIYVFGLTLGDYAKKGSVYNKPGSGQYIHVLDPSLSQTVLSTTFGTGNGVGTIDLVPTAFTVSKCGNIYIAGWGGKINVNNGYNQTSTTKGLPVSSDAIQKETDGSNFYFAIFEKNMASLLYATYFGVVKAEEGFEPRGDHLDGGTCRFDKNGIIYHTACVCKPRGSDFVGFPIENAVQPSHNNDNCNMAAFKLDLGSLKADFNLVDKEKVNPEVVCALTDINFDNLSKGGITFEWFVNDTLVSRIKETKYRFVNEGVYDVKLKAYNKITCTTVDSTFRKIKVISFIAEVSPDTAVCPGSALKLYAKGGLNYQWLPANKYVNPQSDIQDVVVNDAFTYNVEISNEYCTLKKEIVVNILEKEDFEVSKDQEICRDQKIELKALSNQTNEFIWTLEPGVERTAQSVVVQPEKTTTYSVMAIYPDGCKPKKQVTLTIGDSYRPDFQYNIKYSCQKPMELVFDNVSFKDGITYDWQMGNGDSLRIAVPENYRYTDSGNYLVKLTARNSVGCAMSITRNLEIPENDGIIPNAFSPNGDGKNETFEIGFPNASLSIYTRWGKEIYKNDSYNQEWGKGVQAGVYFYKIKLDTGELCKGWVEVFK